MAEAQSVTTFVMSATLPWPDDAPPADALGALDRVAVYAAGQRRESAIRRISSLGTTVRGVITHVPGDDVSIELATGQRPAGTVDWVAGGEAGIRFKQPIDMLALLNRKLVSQPGERRTMPRVELRCPVGIKWSGCLAASHAAQHFGARAPGRRRRPSPARHLRRAVHRRPGRARGRSGVAQGQSGRDRTDGGAQLVLDHAVDPGNGRKVAA